MTELDGTRSDVTADERVARASRTQRSTDIGPRSTRGRRRRSHAVAQLVLAAGSVLMLGPYAHEVLTSLKTLPETLSVPPVLVPGNPQWLNYQAVFDVVPLARQILNSFLISLARVVGQLILCTAAAYAFARLEFRFRRLLFALVLSVLMVPGQLFLIPTYQIMAGLGWLDTLRALFIPHVFNAFGVFLLTQFFRQLPKELDEAARIDGCNPLQILVLVLLPLVRPGMVALGILTLVWSWNDLLWPLVVNTSPDKMPVAAGLALLQGQYLTNYPLLMAGAVVATAPIIILFALLQRQFIQGLAASGLK